MKVFIFGSNGQGFHGAGAAAFAFTGQNANVWRTHPWCQEAIRGGNKLGLMAEWGVARGFQMGRRPNRSSYAIQTVERPGQRGNVSFHDIQNQVCQLILFMREHPDWEFCASRFGAGHAGWPVELLYPLWELICQEPNGRMAIEKPQS